MPLSGIIFVSLRHQSNRKTMFKKTDPNPQLDMCLRLPQHIKEVFCPNICQKLCDNQD